MNTTLLKRLTTICILITVIWVYTSFFMSPGSKPKASQMATVGTVVREQPRPQGGFVNIQKIEPPKIQYRYDAIRWMTYDPDGQIQRLKESGVKIPTFNKEDIAKKYSHLYLGESFQHDKWIILTTIAGPTDDVKFMAQLKGWRVVVVGDTKTPADWSWPNCDYLSVEFQEMMGLQLPRILPYKNYARKNAGYLYAIAHGAKIIYETDDDNRPTDNLLSFDVTKNISGMMFAGSRLLNLYQYFGQSTLWQRGYPLGSVGAKTVNDFRVSSSWPTPMVQQGVVNGDPDMDAVFRLTRKFTDFPLEVTFDPSAPPVILPPGVFSPYNTQNTLVLQPAFWSLFLSGTLNFRITDIWRNYIAQRLLWEIGGYVAFYPPNAYQQRNAHDIMKDFADESQMYYTTEDLLDMLYTWSCPEELTFFQCYYKLYFDVVSKGNVIFAEKDLSAATKWIEDIIMLGYEEPKRIKFKSPDNKGGQGLEELKSQILQRGTPVYFAAAEQKEPTISWQPEKVTSAGWRHATEISSLCPQITSFPTSFIQSRDKVHSVLNDVLLVIYYTSTNYANVKNLEVYYRSMFPNMVYCGQDYKEFEKTTKAMKLNNKQTFIEIPQKFAADHICTAKALQMKYKVSGYLTIRDDILLTLPSMVDLKKDLVWTTVFTNANTTSTEANNIVLNGVNGQTAYKNAISDLENIKPRVPENAIPSTAFTSSLKGISSVPFASRSAFFIPSRLRESAEYYLSYFGQQEVTSEIAFPAVLQGIEDSSKFGSLPGAGVLRSGVSHDAAKVCTILGGDIGQQATPPVKV